MVVRIVDVVVGQIHPRKDPISGHLRPTVRAAQLIHGLVGALEQDTGVCPE